MITKEKILEEIRRTAKGNGGVPLGRGKFERETGINQYQIAKFWSSYGAAQREAGFEPNTLNTAHDLEFLKESMVSLIREIGKFPVPADLSVKRNQDSNFPSPKSFDRLGNRLEKLKKISDYAQEKGYSDVVAICAPLLEISKPEIQDTDSDEMLGEVYLFKSGRYYKIGKTNDTVRRGTELRIQLPEKLDLIHSIKTDDPSGIEAYWHRRFDAKRMNGEWFDLSASDIKMFKRWKRIY